MTALVFRSPGRVLAAIAAAVVLLAAGGCSLTRPAPVKHTFLIDPPAPAAMSRVHPGSLRVGAIGVAALPSLRLSPPSSTTGRFYSEFLVPPGASARPPRGHWTARGFSRR
jgi:hypothetical protein